MIDKTCLQTTSTALLRAVATTLRDRLDPNEPARKTLTDAIDDMTFAAAALGTSLPPGTWA